jgi:hypothetical protein
MHSEITATPDRTKVGDQNSAYTLALAAKALGHDPKQIKLNKELIRRK